MMLEENCKGWGLVVYKDLVISHILIKYQDLNEVVDKCVEGNSPGGTED